MFNDKVVLITGGTGSLGKKFLRMVLQNYKPKKIIILSRDELKQYEMMQKFDPAKYPIRYFLGDVRDVDRLKRAMRGVDMVVHAAALKHVPAAEYNPSEFIKSNILGAQNIIDATLESGVKKVVALSTDKACNPANLYGATKLASDKLFVAANAYSGIDGTKFSVVRYGNVVGSRGSVIPFFLNEKVKGSIPITDPEMTRFWITLEEGVRLVWLAFEKSLGGEIFVPKIPSMNIMDVAAVVAPEAKTNIIGIRPGEKMHECMISEDDARSTLDFNSYYTIMPAIHGWDQDPKRIQGGTRVPNNFRYSSEINPQKLSREQLAILLKSFEHFGHELVAKEDLKPL